MGFYHQMQREHQLKGVKTLPLCCTKAYRDYSGIRKPKCCSGKGCQVCWTIYRAKAGDESFFRDFPVRI